MKLSSDSVRALVRGLDILRFLNKSGAATVSEIATELSLPRPTVYRLLHTLEDEGYVEHSGTDARVRVAPLAAALGDNAPLRSRLCQVAIPIMKQFTDTHAWPTDLSIYHDTHMVVQETTHPSSPLSVDAGMVGFKLPVLRSSAGRSYLSACNKNERQLILDMLRAAGETEDEQFLDANWLDEHLATYSEQGFATRGPRTFRPKTSSLAVPILANANVVGCLSIIWITKAMTMEQAIDKYAAALMLASREIATRLAAPVGVEHIL